jgi:hypothetical protein
MSNTEPVTKFASREIQTNVGDRDALWMIATEIPISEDEKSREFMCLEVTVTHPDGSEGWAVIVTRGSRTQAALQVLTSGRYAIAVKLMQNVEIRKG